MPCKRVCYSAIPSRSLAVFLCVFLFLHVLSCCASLCQELFVPARLVVYLSLFLCL